MANFLGTANSGTPGATRFFVAMLYWQLHMPATYVYHNHVQHFTAVKGAQSGMIVVI